MICNQFEKNLRCSLFKRALKVCSGDPVEGADLPLDHQVLLLVRSRVWAKQRLVAANHYVPERNESKYA